MTELGIVAFLTRCLDENQELAEAAASVDPAPWTADATDERDTDQRSGHGFGVVVAADEVALWDCEGSSTLCMTAPTTRFVAAHDPARVLADIAAKRRVLGRHKPVKLDPYWLAKTLACDGCGHDAAYGHNVPNIEDCPELRDMASGFADRPGYNPAWTMED